MRVTALLAGVALLWACGDDGGVRPDSDGPPTGTIRVEPADITLTVTNGATASQAYTATFIEADGDEVDVTAQAVFTFANPAFGAWSGPSAAVSGLAAGQTRVTAMANGFSGDTGLTVLVDQTVIDPDVDPTLIDPFDTATEDASLAPTVAYPLDGILVPPNLGQFDVHWRNSTTAPTPPDVFRIRMQNDYVDIKRYTRGLPTASPVPFWMVFEPSQWYPIASSRQQLGLEVSGMVSTDPSKKGTAVTQTVDVTNENAKGGIYYWSTSSPQGIYRYDVATPEVPPAPYFPAGQEPGGQSNCMGCHTLSRDGSKLALTIDGGDGRGTVVNVSDRAVLVPYDNVAQPALYWNFATFTPTADKMVTVSRGNMQLREVNGGALLADIPNTAGKVATHPEISPDGTLLVNVETTQLVYDFQVGNGEIVVRSFDPTTNTFGTPTVLLEAGADNLNSYYPSFSPDGQWLVITRAPTGSYDNPDASTWIMRSDGSSPPVRLAQADIADGLYNSWARWVPFGQTFGDSNESLFYLTYSTRRAFGVRIPNGGIPQIWMTPVFPGRAAQGLDPSGKAFRVPFQSTITNNHIAQWTEQVVVIGKSAK